MLPKILKEFNCWIDGVGTDGVVPELTLPKITRKLEDYRGGTMMGDVKVDLGVEAMECEIKFGGYMEEVLATMGTSINGTLFRFAGVAEREDTGDIIGLEIEMRGRFGEYDWGSQKAGDMSDHGATFHPTYYKLIREGKDVLEIDMLAGIWKVNGKDMNEKKRKILGLP